MFSGTVIVPLFPQMIDEILSWIFFEVVLLLILYRLHVFKERLVLLNILRDFLHAFILFYTNPPCRCTEMDLRRGKYANYRYSNYMQEGLAVLKVGSSVEAAKFTNDLISKNNNILYLTKCEFVPKNSVASSPSKFHDANSTTWERKKPYEDKAIRTTKNFIGKSCYNVGSKILSSRFLSFFK